MKKTNKLPEQYIEEVARMLELKQDAGRKDYLEGLHQGFMLIELFSPSALKQKPLAELKGKKFDGIWIDEE